jgi:protein ImuB
MFACVYAPDWRATLSGSPSGGPERPALQEIAREFSPRYETHGELVVIDVRGLDRLLGDARTIGEELRREAADRDLRAHVAVAGTQTAARVLAMARPGLTVVETGGEAEALASISVDVLCRAALSGPPGRGPERPALQDDAAISSFKRWGLKTLGEIAALPPAELSARLGRQSLRWQLMARGDDDRPLVPDAADERFDASLDLEWPIEGLEPLSFVLTRLLEPLSIRLERRDRGVAVLHVHLRLVTKDIHARRLELPSPLRDVRALRTLALLDLESHPPPGENIAVDRVTVSIDPTPGRILQHTLFTRPQPTPEQLSTLLARLGAAMGQDRIGAPAVVDSYRPGAFAMTPFAVEHDRRAPSPEPRAASLEPTALRRCRQPVPARVAVDAAGRPVRVTTDRRGFAGGAVQRAAGPWKTSGEWWVTEAGGARARESLPRRSSPASLASEGGGWDRDEWDVALSDGGAYRIFLDHLTHGWFIEAVID